MMEIIFILIAGFVVLILAMVSIIKMATTRVTAPTNQLKEEVLYLEKRIDELENEKTNNQ